MEKRLKQILRQDGLPILQEPAQLQARLTELGAAPESALRWGLLLTACPGVASLVSQTEVSPAEVQAVTTAAIQASDLHPMRVRKMIGQLLTAAEVRLPPALLLPAHKKRVRATLELPEEEKLLQKALSVSSSDPEMALNTLQTFSDNGNGLASYCLGVYFRQRDVAGVEKPATERSYFEKAAAQGYGPAYGALADYALHGERKQLDLAARYFAHPTALTGENGKAWSKNAAELLNYREHNLTQGRTALLISLLSLMCITLTGIFSGSPWAIPVALAAAFCVLRCVLSLLAFPYASYRGVYTLLTVCWLLGGILCII